MQSRRQDAKLDITLGLRSLLTPLSPDVFFNEHWENQALLIQRDMPGFYANLFSVRELDRLLALSPISYPKIRAIKKDAPDQSIDLMKDALSREDNFIKTVNDAYRLYAQGCTLFLERLERRSPEIRSF